MAITLEERITSRATTVNIDGVGMKEIYHVKDGGNDPYSILGDLSAIGSAHPTVAFSTLESIGVKRVEAGSDLLEVTYNYTPPSKGDGANANDEIWEWDLTSRTAHIDSVENIETAPPGTFEPNQLTYDADNETTAKADRKLNLIGVDGDNVKGVDVYRPTGSLRVTKTYSPITAFDSADRAVIAAARNTTNDDTFVDWTAGEVLFLGARIRYSTVNNNAQVTYNFLFGASQTDVKFDVWKLTDPVVDASTAEVTLATVLPFEYIWGDPVKKKVPVSLGDPDLGFKWEKHFQTINQATVYQPSDFDLLGLVGP